MLHRRTEVTVRDEKLEDLAIYRVVINQEEQYSIWPADWEIPPGWREAGKTGTKAECLAHIDQVWTDMRPLSLRRRLEQTSVESEGRS